AAQHVAHEVHALAGGELLHLVAERLHVVARLEAVELLLVDRLDAHLGEELASLRRTRAEERAMAFRLREHEEQLADAAAEGQHCPPRASLDRHLEAKEAERATPELIRRGRGERQRSHPPERQPALERRLDPLPLADDGLLAVPADRLGLIVRPDPQRIAV